MTVLLAMLLDQFLGEPPVRLHPVVWIGQYLRCVGEGLPGLRPFLAFLSGALLWVFGAALCVGFAWLLEHSLSGRSPWLVVPLALLLKPLFAFRLLREEVRGVETALGKGLPEGRLRLARIVSRKTELLSAAEVRESALESLSENLNDSLVAPLFWYLLLGLPGVALHRFANTADAMWGYRGAWEWAGKWSAVADDVLGWVPARITAVLLLFAAMAPWGAWRRLRTEAGRTPSPNSGWPMSALALALGVRLGKPGVYVLNADAPEPTERGLEAALRLVLIAGWLWACLVASLALVGGGFLHA
jgi:adenosylcobinamide-phosphate synthase